LEKLLFQSDDQLFCLDLEFVIIVDRYEKVKNEIDGIKLIDFRKLYSQFEKPAGEEIIFIGKNDEVLGILVDKILKVIKTSEISPYKNEKFMLEYIKGVMKISDFENCYLLDAKKILEVAYEK